MPAPANDVTALVDALRRRGYLADRGTGMAAHLAEVLARPLLVEGAPGVGKTALAIALAEARDLELVRLQCHEGLDRDQALYAWDHARQLLHLRTVEARGQAHELEVDALYDERFLVARPLLRALRRGRKALLLIDEIDRADDEFEAFLLEFLADFQITIPEIGTVAADGAPRVVLTSNRTRELSDALRRRCLYHWLSPPPPQVELAIVALKAPEVAPRLAEQVVAAVGRLREHDLYKPPGIAETIDWARVLSSLGDGGEALDVDAWIATLGVVVKDHDDLRVAMAAMADDADPW